MIIDSKRYTGPCACGKNHKMETELCVIEAGCLKRADELIKQYVPGGYTVAVYDENTYKATAGRHIKADLEVVLDPDNLHANERGVELLQSRLPENAEVLVAVGSGTVHDITRYCSYLRKTEFISCPTAASVDGFCSSVAAMTWHGCKKTLTAKAPRLVIADTDIIKAAPVRLARSGFGDMAGKFIALTDWKIGHILKGEFYCERIAGMTLTAAKGVISSVSGIEKGDEKTYELLMYGLLLSGLAMQMMTNSRPASGAEHHISHLIEMSPAGLGLASEALHGEKVGVGTLLALKEYKRIASLKGGGFADYTPCPEKTVTDIFGHDTAKDIIAENKNDAAAGVTGELIKEKHGEILSVLSQLPDTDELTAIYKAACIKSSLSDIDVSPTAADTLLEYSPLVRNRLTLMRIRKCFL